MKYDFDEIIPRRGTNSVKWDLATDERVLPMCCLLYTSDAADE